jgi:predicted 2-oxoglutarate/Fe(II)-dependent dioxygenase YbiX
MVDVEALRREAAADDPAAQIELARILLVGLDAPHDPAEALRLVNAACAQRCPQALLFHAMLATLGLGRRQSWSDAVSYVAEAAALGDARASGMLAALGGADGFKLENWFASAAVERRCDAPRIFTVEKFLPEAVCSWLVEQSKPRLTAATVKNPTRGRSTVEGSRTNTSAAFSTIEPDLVLQLTCQRIAAAIGAPLRHQEPTNVLRYAVGQEYRPHFDFIVAEDEAAFSGELNLVGQRLCTVLVYLNEDYEGGETAFPRLNWRYKGKTGDALVFWNLSAEGQPERASLHAGLPVTRGEKWLLSKWVREKPYPLI